jgi:hypothetical protein
MISMRKFRAPVVKSFRATNGALDKRTYSDAQHFSNPETPHYYTVSWSIVDKVEELKCLKMD